MSTKTVQVGSNSFEIPLEGSNAGWGEELSSFLVAVAQALSTVQGPNDILLTTFTLSNNVSSPTDVAGMTFDLGEVQSVEVDFLIYRIYDSGITTIAESGKILANYDGSTFNFSQESTGDSGVIFSVTPSGQFQYTSTNLSNHVSSVLKYKAKTIDS